MAKAPLHSSGARTVRGILENRRRAPSRGETNGHRQRGEAPCRLPSSPCAVRAQGAGPSGRALPQLPGPVSALRDQLVAGGRAGRRLAAVAAGVSTRRYASTSSPTSKRSAPSAPATEPAQHELERLQMSTGSSPDRSRRLHRGRGRGRSRVLRGLHRDPSRAQLHDATGLTRPPWSSSARRWPDACGPTETRSGGWHRGATISPGARRRGGERRTVRTLGFGARGGSPDKPRPSGSATRTSRRIDAPVLRPARLIRMLAAEASSVRILLKTRRLICWQPVFQTEGRWFEPSRARHLSRPVSAAKRPCDRGEGNPPGHGAGLRARGRRD